MDEKESILIVDDDESTRRSLSLVLGRNGYEVEAIGTGRETLQQVKDRSFNVALLDIRLPDTTGIELLASLKELYPDMAVIMVTGYASVDTAILALNKGASAYITKPLNLDEVLICVERAVEKQDLVREKRQAAELLRQTNRALRVLSACNGILVHAEDEDKLLQQVCKVITSIGEFPLAWVGYAEHDEGKSVTPVAFSGTGVAYVASLDISSSDNARGCAVVETAIRTQEVVLNRDYLTNPCCASCRERAIKHDLRSSIVLPLIVNDTCIGALSVHASQADIFSEEEVQLLTELANDLAFGIQTLREVTAHQKAEAAKVQAETRYQRLFESLPVGIYRVLGDGQILDANPALVGMLGCPNRESLLDMNSKDFFVDAGEWETLRQRTQEEDMVHGYVEQLRRPDGKTVWAVDSMHISRDADGNITCFEGSLQDITERMEAETALRRAFERIIQTVAATLEVRDPYTAGHQRRVTNLACIIAARMGLSDKNVMALRMAGSIHDLGKISVPAEILSKPSKLTDAEYQLIQEHVEAGYNLLKDIDFPWPVAEIVLQHHERLDGSGYPRGLHGEDILIEAKIIAVADTVEAMSSHRPYRPALGIDVALEEISKDRGVRYDPQVVDACLEVFSDGGFDFEDQSE